MTSLIERVISDNYNDLTRTDISHLKKLNSMIETIPKKGIQEVANECFTSTATISRLIKKIGFEGYSDFKFQIANDNRARQDLKITANNRMENILDEMQLTYAINEKQLKKIAEVILAKSDRYCFGTGWRQKQIIDNFSSDLLYYNETFKTLRTTEDFNITANNMTDNSLIIIVSVHGTPSSYLEALQKCILKGVTIISITIESQNELSEMADYAMYYKDRSVGRNSHHWNALPLSFLLEALIQTILAVRSNK